jgi:hypothetical protein
MKVDIDELRDYILLMEEKIKLLKYNFKTNQVVIRTFKIK